MAVGEQRYGAVHLLEGGTAGQYRQVELRGLPLQGGHARLQGGKGGEIAGGKGGERRASWKSSRMGKRKPSSKHLPPSPPLHGRLGRHHARPHGASCTWHRPLFPHKPPLPSTCPTTFPTFRHASSHAYSSAPAEAASSDAATTAAAGSTAEAAAAHAVVARRAGRPVAAAMAAPTTSRRWGAILREKGEGAMRSMKAQVLWVWTAEVRCDDEACDTR